MNYEEWAKKYAPEQYEKYYIINKLPKIKSAEDSVLEKQLGFYDENNILQFIPENVIINNVHIIAGRETSTIFRSAHKYAEKYGGNPKDWMKKVGKVESAKYIFDIHFVEHEEYGRYDYKLKGKKLK